MQCALTCSPSSKACETENYFPSKIAHENVLKHMCYLLLQLYPSKIHYFRIECNQNKSTCYVMHNSPTVSHQKAMEVPVDSNQHTINNKSQTARRPRISIFKTKSTQLQKTQKLSFQHNCYFHYL